MKITFIGSGASSAAVLFNLIEAISASGNTRHVEQILLIDKSGSFGCGIAYSTHENHHLFNSRAGKIGIKAGNKEHFLAWLLENKNTWAPLFHELGGIEISGDSFLPRRLFGMYLKDMMREAETKAEMMGISIVKIRAEVTDIAEQQNKAFIKTSDGQILECDKAIIATGNPPTRRMEALEGNPKYIAAYWPGADVSMIPKGAPVTVIGTGLTAVDLLLTLQANGHLGKIVFLSSSGKFPDVHPEKSLPPYQRKILTVEEAMAQGKAFTADTLHGLLEHELATAQSEGADRRSVIDSLRANGDIIQFWRMLCPAEQKKWDGTYGSWYSAMRFRMPPESWKKIAQAFDSGQASFIKARADASLQVSTEHYIVNCSGPSFQEDSLITTLAAHGKILSHPSGGLAADEHMFVKRPDGSSSNTIMAIGLLRRGEDYEVNAIPEITEQAKTLVHSLLK